MRCFAALLLACLLHAADPRPLPTHQREAPSKTAPKLSDPQLESAIRAKFAKSKINADKFQVHVQGGVATLEGRTDVIQHKGTATRLARTSGALAVNNRIQISDAARQRATANLEKGRRRVQLQRGEPRTEAAATPRRR
jgi:hypothetical protein